LFFFSPPLSISSPASVGRVLYCGHSYAHVKILFLLSSLLFFRDSDASVDFPNMASLLLLLLLQSLLLRRRHRLRRGGWWSDALPFLFLRFSFLFFCFLSRRIALNLHRGDCVCDAFTAAIGMALGLKLPGGICKMGFNRAPPRAPPPAPAPAPAPPPPPPP
jgi:hypothetical protein